MSKIAIVNLETLQIASWYEESAPRQSNFGGDWGDASKFAHLAFSEAMDQECAEAVLVNGAPVLQENAALKSAKAAAAPLKAAKAAVASAMSFGSALVEDFAAENVLLGITADGMTGAVLDNMASVMNALKSGSLYEAIVRIKAMPAESKDAKYITDSRLLEAVNKLEAFLGLPLSSSLA